MFAVGGKAGTPTSWGRQEHRPSLPNMPVRELVQLNMQLGKREGKRGACWLGRVLLGGPRGARVRASR